MSSHRLMFTFVHEPRLGGGLGGTFQGARAWYIRECLNETDPQYCGSHTGARKDESSSPSVGGDLDATYSARKLPVGRVRDPKPRSRQGNCTYGVCALLASSCGVLWLSLVLVWDDSGSHPRRCSFRHCGVVSCQPCAITLCWDRRKPQGTPAGGCLGSLST